MLARSARPAQVLGFLGAAGGAGTTTMVLNVAAALAKQGASVIAVELQPWGGAFAAQTQQVPPSDIGQLFARDIPHLTAADIEPALAHVPPGIALLYGPREDGVLTPERVENLLRALSELAQYVLVDLPHGPSDVARTAARHCDQVTVIFPADRVSASLAQSSVALLKQWGVGPNRMNAIAVRRSEHAGDVNLTELAAGLGADLIGAVPFAADALALAHESGRRLVEEKPSHAASSSTVWISNQLISQVGARLRVAVIDDPDGVDLITGYLAGCNSPRFEVRAFADFDGALQATIPGEFDLVFLGVDDAQTGLERLCTLQLSVPDTPIVALLEADDEELSLAAARSGAQDSIVKTQLDARWLLRVVRHALERQRLIADLAKRSVALARCEAVYRKLIAKLLREGQNDPRIV